MLFEAIESRVFDIYGPLETLSSFRTNDNVERCNATTWLVKFESHDLKFSATARSRKFRLPQVRKKYIPCTDLLSNSCIEASCFLNSNTSSEVAVVSGGETKTWICSSAGESGKYFEIFFIASSSSLSLSERLLKGSARSS